ncbi:MAG: hypothetical protein ACM3JH_16280 [Acidithiobacillales bacterium]
MAKVKAKPEQIISALAEVPNLLANAIVWVSKQKKPITIELPYKPTAYPGPTPPGPGPFCAICGVPMPVGPCPLEVLRGIVRIMPKKLMSPPSSLKKVGNLADLGPTVRRRYQSKTPVPA